jgi:hypothetical protein
MDSIAPVQPVSPSGQRSYDRLVFAAPPVQVTCECGEARSLAYGERWTCERCGKRWNTEQIPADEYQALARAIRRYQLTSLAFGVVMLAVFAPLTLLVDLRIGVTGILVFFVWAFLLRPRRRQKLLRRATSPRWQLSPE